VSLGSLVASANSAGFWEAAWQLFAELRPRTGFFLEAVYGY
jgi:hypothetical protein